jgi:hypothetical protein
MAKRTHGSTAKIRMQRGNSRDFLFNTEKSRVELRKAEIFFQHREKQRFSFNTEKSRVEQRKAELNREKQRKYLNKALKRGRAVINHFATSPFRHLAISLPRPKTST